MVIVDAQRCTGCKLCARECPVGAIAMEQKLAVSSDACVHCRLCIRLCPHEAMAFPEAMPDQSVRCSNCPVSCEILPGFSGACRRYKNEDGMLRLTAPLVVPVHSGPRRQVVLDPLVTGVGAGTTAPCFNPAPYVVEDTIDGVDVVTVVSEVPFSYSGMKLKVDTNAFLGEEGARIRRDGRVVGRVETEEYGSKMLALGGVNTLHGASGSTAARTMVDLCNGRRVEIKIENGARVAVEVGRPPMIDGVEPDLMRVGCGSATTAMFAPYLQAVADETIVLDPDITGLLTEHAAGRALGLHWSGVVPVGAKSTAGRYFGTAGAGIGGTDILVPAGAVARVDPAATQPGMTLFVTDTAGESGFLLRLLDDGAWEPLDLTPEALKAMAVIRENGQQTRVSALLVCGAGGSARSGVTKFPIKLNEAVHDGRVRLTSGGADVFLYPGGGITFMVNVEHLPPGTVTWVPTPALVAPVEYTMTRKVYAAVEGHLDALRRRGDVLAEREHVTFTRGAAGEAATGHGLLDR